MLVDSYAKAELYRKRFRYNPINDIYLRDDPILFLVRNVKARLEHDRKWIGRNNSTELAQPIWSIISDYWSEDPRIVDMIMCSHNIQFALPGSCYGEMLGPPNQFWITHTNALWSSVDRNSVYLDVNAENPNTDLDESWIYRDDEVMTTLLIMPTLSSDWCESENICDNPYITWIRGYLYQQLERPDKSGECESDY